jgi:hypothetical protein
MSTRTRLATLAATALLAACSDSTAPAESDPTISAQVTADVAAQAGDAAAEDVAILRVNGGAFGLPTLDQERFERWSSCPFVEATGWFTCADRVRGPWTSTRRYQFRDAQGRAQTAYDAVATAAATFDWTVRGTFDRSRWEGSSERRRSVTFSGLAGAETQVTIDGTGTDARNRTRFAQPNASGGAAGGERSYEMSATLRIDAVVVPVPRLATGWPTSGTITRTFTGTRTGPGGTRTVERTAVVTFDGTSTASLVVGGRRFTLDLVTGDATPVSGS